MGLECTRTPSATLPTELSGSTVQCKCSTVLYSAVQCSAVQDRTGQCSAVQYCSVQSGRRQYSFATEHAVLPNSMYHVPCALVCGVQEETERWEWVLPPPSRKMGTPKSSSGVERKSKTAHKRLLKGTVLCHNVLYCSVLFCTVVHCTVLYSTVQCSTVLYGTVLHCTVLYCTVQYCTALFSVLTSLVSTPCAHIFCRGCPDLCRIVVLCPPLFNRLRVLPVQARADQPGVHPPAHHRTSLPLCCFAGLWPGQTSGAPCASGC